MNTSTIAIQQLMVQQKAQAQQSKNGVVNIASEKQGVEKEQSFNKIFERLMKEDIQLEQGESILEQLLEENGGENAQELAQQLMAQNPLLAMLLANSMASNESIESALTQLTQSVQMLQGEGSQEVVLDSITIQQEAPATSQQVTPQQVVATPFDTILQANAQATQAQATIAQPVVEQNVTANVQGEVTRTDALAQGDTKPLVEATMDIKVTSTTQKQDQPQILAAKADSEVVAQKLKVDVATAQQGSTRQESSDEKSDASKAIAQPKQAEVKDTISNEQATQATFEKQLASTQPIKTEEFATKPTETQEIIRQTAQGIKENVAAGKQEFVMKLTPQGLGEITVKLVSENGRTIMQLTAQNQNVQRILGAELEALRQAVRPFNVEVKEVNTANQSQLDMSNQSNQQQQQYQSNASNFFFNQQQGRQHTKQGYISYNHPAEIASDDNPVKQHITSTKAINLHI